MTGASQSPSAAGQAWALNPIVRLRWRVWEEGCVAFEAVSGETATVDAADAAILACCGPDPLTVSEVTQSLARDLGVDPGEALHAQVAAALAGFTARGWLEVHTPAA